MIVVKRINIGRQRGMAFNELLDITRKEKSITLRQLSYGLCSEAEMSFILSGARLPSYQLRNRFMSRIDINPEGFEDFIDKAEYDIWLKINTLLFYLRNNNLSEAEKLLYRFKDLTIDVLQKQIVLDVAARILKIKGAPKEIVRDKYYEAICLSMGKIDLKQLPKYLLSPYEYILIFEYLHIKALDSSNDLKDRIIDTFFKMIDYVISLEICDLSKVKILPRAVCLLYGVLSNQNTPRCELYNKIKVFTDYSISLLKRTNRLYSLIELVQVRQELKCSSKEDNELSLSLKEYYYEYNIPASDLFDTYMYEETMVYNISDVIKSRRILFGKTQKDISEGVCSLKTICRIEQNETNPQPSTLKLLLQKLNIFSDYRRSEIITKEVDVIRLYDSYKLAKNCKDVELAKSLLISLNDRIDRNIPSNCQILNKLFLDAEYDNNISGIDYRKKLEELLKITLDVNYMQSGLKGDLPYLTIAEKKILFSIIRFEHENGIKDSGYQFFLKGICSKTENHLIHAFGIKYYELYAGLYASIMVKEHDYKRSNDTLKTIIHYNLSERRNTCLAQSLYGTMRNEAVRTQNFYDQIYNDQFLEILSFSSFTLDKRDHEVFENNFQKYRNCINWTI